MWMTDRQAREDLREPAAELGQVTLPGGGGVSLAGERRNVTLCLPGGYHWTPRRGETVLVIKSGPDQAPCVAGQAAEAPDLTPGEVVLSVQEGTSIRLKAGGGIEITGRVDVTGGLTVNGREV